MKNRIAAAAATMTCVLLTLTAAQTPAQAGSLDRAQAAGHSVTIRTAGLALDSAEAQAMVKRRIRAAAKTVCMARASQPGRMGAKSRQCVHASYDQGLRQLNRITAASTGTVNRAFASLPARAVTIK